MADKTQTREPLRAYLATAGPLNAAATISVVQSVVEEVAALHNAGKWHGAIGADSIFVDDALNVSLSARNSGDAIAMPPEFTGEISLPIPTDIDAARAALRAAGSNIDPRRIDIYQIGRLACELLLGDGPDEYLYSARAKQRIPAPLRGLLDGMLGYDDKARFASCDDVQPVLQRAAAASIAAVAETPPRGTGVDVTDNTPTTPHPAAHPLAGASAAASAIPFTKLGHYRVDARLGSGGMGDVYRGYEAALDRTVALKVLPPELARQPDFVQRFVDEAKAAARLVHPNIVQIFYIGEDAGRNFFAMQYVDGETLASRLARERRLNLDDALAIAEQVLAGLAVAHARGMIHRDIKPGNILLDAPHRRALLADFGLVKSLDSSAQMTATGMVMGTVDYISPEQGRGQSVDGRSDLYSTGVLLYQMLSGRLPFEAESPTAMIFQHAYEKPRPLEEVVPGLPAGAREIVHRLLAKSPADRYQTAEELLADVRSLRASHDFEPLPQSSGTPATGDRQASVIIAAPKFEFAEAERQATAVLAALPPLSWRDRLRALFHRHVPEALKSLQNTEQQIDGALALFQVRRERLAQLELEARAVRDELALQLKAHEQAAAQTTEASDERREQDELVDDLAAQLAEQRDQLDDIQLLRAKADATVEKLRSEHAILRARLRMAAADRIVAAAGERSRARTSPWMIGGALAAAALLVAFGLVVPRPNSNTPVYAPALIDSAPVTTPTSDIAWTWTPPVNAGSRVNSGGAGGPFMTADGLTLLFHSNRAGGYGKSDIYMSTRASRNDGWGTSQNLGPKINGDGNDEFAVLGSDGLTLLYRKQLSNDGRWGDYVVGKRSGIGEPWGDPVDIGSPINGNFNNGGAELSEDQLTLWFSSDRHGGYGDQDLWVSRRPSIDARWGEPQNLGPQINSNAPEFSPTLTPDGRTIVFYSERKGGLGKYDLWMSTRESSSNQFGPPINLGMPINSSERDSNPRFSAKGETLLFLSRRPGGYGDDDIWWTRRVPKAGDEQIASSAVLPPAASFEWSPPVAENDVNAGSAEGGALVAADGLTMLFHSNRAGGSAHTDIYQSRRASAEDPWSPPENLGPTINGGGYEEFPFLTDDGLTLLYHSRRGGREGWGNFMIATRPSAEAPWNPPTPIGEPIDGSFYNHQAHLANDGLTLWFDSDRPGGQGDADLWVARRASADARWGEPENLGPTINTAAREQSPTLSPDGRALFFASDRPGGQGQLDLWMARRGDDGHYQRPVNLGPTVNSAADDANPRLDADEQTLRFESTRAGGGDIWRTQRRTRQAEASHRPTQNNLNAWSPPENAGPVVNSESPDGGPYVTPDGLTLLFNSDRPGGYGSNDLYSCTRAAVNDAWGPPQNLGSTVNGAGSEELPSMMPDGLMLLFHQQRADNGPGGLKFCTRPTLDVPWSEPTLMPGRINGPRNSGQAFLSNDRLTLWFDSNRGGGYGDTDLWMCRRSAVNQAWREPKNLGAAVNSSSREQSPSLSADERVLFFASDRPGGRGQLDIWAATRNEKGDFERPVNLGAKVNSSADDATPRLTGDGRTLWFASTRPGGAGRRDLWSTRWEPSAQAAAARPTPTTSSPPAPTASQPLMASFNSLSFQKLQRQFLEREVRAAYASAGRRDPKWNEAADKFLAAWIEWSVAPYSAPNVDELLDLASQATAAGCNDPMVRYCEGCLLRSQGKNYEAANALRPAYEGFIETPYDVSFRCWAAGQIAEALAAAGSASDAEPFRADERTLLASVVAQANYQPSEVRLLWTRIQEQFIEQPSLEEAEANWLAVSDAKMSPWLSHCWQGRLDLRRAMDARQHPKESTTREERQAYATDHLAMAGEHFQAAWELDAAVPEAANLMLAIVRLQDAPMADLQTWFDRVRAADFDYYPPFTQVRYVMQNAGGVTHADMIAKGREYLATKRFDTIVPFTMLEFASPTIPRVGQPFEFFDKDGAYDDLVSMAGGYLAEPTMKWAHPWMSSFLVALAIRCQRWYDAAARLAELPGDPDPSAFFRCGISLTEGVGEVLARTGPAAEQVKQAEQLAAAAHLEPAIQAFSAIKEKANDNRVAAYVDRRLTQLRPVQQFEVEEWVDLVPAPDLGNWWDCYGNWSVSPSGTFVGRSTDDGMLLVCSQPFGVNYTIEGKVKFIEAKYQGNNAGVFFGEPFGRYRREFPYRRWNTTAFTLYEFKDYALLKTAGGENRVDVEVNRDATFRIERRGDVVTTFLGNRMINDSVSLELADVTGGERLAIGGSYWYPGTIIEFQKLRIRKISENRD